MIEISVEESRKPDYLERPQNDWYTFHNINQPTSRSSCIEGHFAMATYLTPAAESIRKEIKALMNDESNVVEDNGTERMYGSAALQKRFRL